MCRKDVKLGNMGKNALFSHMKCDTHKDNMAVRSRQSVGIKMFSAKQPCTSETKESVPEEVIAPASLQQPLQTATIAGFTSDNSVLKAEIIWTMYTIVKHYSYNSNSDIGSIFQAMFPCEVAAKFACGADKTSYLATFGLASHFKKLLEDPFTR